MAAARAKGVAVRVTEGLVAVGLATVAAAMPTVVAAITTAGSTAAGSVNRHRSVLC